MRDMAEVLGKAPPPRCERSVLAETEARLPGCPLRGRRAEDGELTNANDQMYQETSSFRPQEVVFLRNVAWLHWRHDVNFELWQ